MSKQDNTKLLTINHFSYVKIICLYIFISILWLIISDYFIAIFPFANILKDVKTLIYIITTAALLYFLLQKYTSSIITSQQQLQETNDILQSTQKNLTAHINELIYHKNIIYKQNEYLQALLTTIPDLIFIFDKEGNYLECNAMYSQENLKQDQNLKNNNSIYNILPAPIADEFLQLHKKALASKSIEMLEYHIPVNNRLQYSEARLVALNGDHVLAIVRDITEYHKLVNQLECLSTRDPLTNLYNRTYFEQKIQSLNCNDNFPLSVFMIDLNNFKQINDTLGHSAGDSFLKETASILQKTFRSQDVIARIGGDEFAILQPNTPYDIAQNYYNRLKSMANTYQLIEPTSPLSMSVGFATSIDNNITINELVNQADKNMYLEKNEYKKDFL